MSFERDFYEERRRKWRRSAFWKGVFVTLAVLVLIGVAGFFLGGGPRLGDHIARLEISGTIYDDPIRDQVLRDIEANDNAKALILRINSPGGTTVGSEALYLRLISISRKKPVVAVIGEVAASGGYIAALGADYIIARGNSLTGSIGVIMEYPDVTDLMAKIGVAMQTVRSGPLKAEPSPFRTPTPAGVLVDRQLIADSYAWFRGLVGERRRLSGPKLALVADGRVFTGRMALENGLIDALGGEENAVAYFESLSGFPADLPVDSYLPDYGDDGISGIFGKILPYNSVLRELYRRVGPRLYSLAK
jgi:protease IV